MKKDSKIRIFGRVLIIPSKVKWLFVIILAAGVVFAGYVITNKSGDKSILPVAAAETMTPVPSPSEAPMPSPSPVPDIYVYVVGAVNSPGVYNIPSGSMVDGAVRAAGGFAEDADLEAVNLVEILFSNAMIDIPSKNENPGNWLKKSGQEQSGDLSALVNINTANVEQLCTLSGVGESTAKKIIKYREANGAFGSIEDIMKVPGIKESKFAAFKDEICV